MEEHISMTIKELDRLEVISTLNRGEISQAEASETLGITIRQVRRLLKKYRSKGAVGLISKKKGAPGNHRLSEALKELSLDLIRTLYMPTNPTFAHEKLTEVHNLKISLSSVRQIMVQNGLWVENKVKKIRIYQLRERRPCLGELEQMDGSPHDWFEGRGPKCSLLYCVDDATGKIMAAIFAPSEALWPYFLLMQQYLNKHGRPLAIYLDKHGVFRVNRKEALSGDGVTQFGRAMKELGIELIFANSAPAKGRIERTNRTLQNRLVQELRLHNISNIAAANAYLPEFIEDFNRRFAVVPKSPNNAHRPLLGSHDLENIFTKKHTRQLSKNLTFQYKNTIYQIKTERESYAMRAAKVMLCEKQDGTISVFYKDKQLKFSVFHYQEKQGSVVDAKRLNEAVDNLQKQSKQQARKQPYKPSKKHPWKRCYKYSMSR
jgi:transposase